MDETTTESLACLVRDYRRAVGARCEVSVEPDAEAIARLVTALVLGGTYCLYLGANFLVPSVNALCDRLRVQFVSQVLDCSSNDIERAIWTSMTAVPDLTVRECRRRIRKVLKSIREHLHDDAAVLLALDDDALREVLDIVFTDPVLALLFAQAIDRKDWRPDSSGGAALMGARIGIVEWHEGLFGMPHIRRECRRALESDSCEAFYALERWSTFCDDMCFCCPSQESCKALCLGAV
jgi:hypothetical protein